MYRHRLRVFRTQLQTSSSDERRNMDLTNERQSKGGRPKGGNRFAAHVMTTIQQLDELLTSEALSHERKAELVKEKAQLLRTFAERLASREIHERHKQKQQRRRLREGPPAPDPPPQGVPLTTAQIVELMRRGSLQAAPSAQHRVEQ
jgi:hypothetical protein